MGFQIGQNSVIEIMIYIKTVHAMHKCRNIMLKIQRH